MAPGVRSDHSAGWRPCPEDRAQPAGRVLPLMLGRYLGELRSREPDVRADLYIEDLHQFRVSLRRARSIMAAGSRVFPEEELVLLRALAAWMMAETSPVRDLDVLAEDLPDLGAKVVPELADGVDLLAVVLGEERDSEHRDLIEALDGERYRVLLRRWEAMASVYRVGGGEPGPDSRRRAGEVVDRLIARSFDRLRRRGAAAVASEERQAWHDLRKAVKRFRYLTAGFVPMYPDGAFDPVLKRLSGLQDALGRLQDHHVQASILEEVGAARGGRAGLAAGVIADSLHRDSHAAQQRCADLWLDFDRPKLRRRLREVLG